jgi:hypothetical protein
MYYIVVALKSEAQAFVDLFQPSKSKLDNYTFFIHKHFKLIISGVGVKNARNATQTLLNHFDINGDDIFINVGVCASQHPIGRLLRVTTLHYQEKSYTLTSNTTKNPFIQETVLECFDQGCNTQGVYESVDMESYGFYDAVIHNPAIQHYAIFKVVSDHFEPTTLTKEGVKKLLFEKLKSKELLSALKHFANEPSQAPSSLSFAPHQNSLTIFQDRLLVYKGYEVSYFLRHL